MDRKDTFRVEIVGIDDFVTFVNIIRGTGVTDLEALKVLTSGLNKESKELNEAIENDSHNPTRRSI